MEEFILIVKFAYPGDFYFYIYSRCSRELFVLILCEVFICV